MEQITNYTDYKINEAVVDVEETEEGVYVLTLQDVKDITNSFTEEEVDEEEILKELENYKFIKVEDPKISELESDELQPEEEIVDELSSDDEDPTLIKKLNELS